MQLTTIILIALAVLGIIIYLLSDIIFSPKLVKMMAEKRMGFLLPEENKIYFVMKGKAFHEAILSSKNYFLDKNWKTTFIKKNTPFIHPHLNTAFRKKYVKLINAWWYGLPWIYKIDRFDIDFIKLVQDVPEGGDGSAVVEKFVKYSKKTDHLRLFYQYLVTTDARTGGENDDGEGETELINIKTRSLYRIKIIDPVKARFNFANHIAYIQTEIAGYIRDFIGDMTIDKLNEANLTDMTNSENPFKIMVDRVNIELRKVVGVEIDDAIFLPFEPADEQAKAVFEATQSVYIAHQQAEAKKKTAAADQESYLIRLGVPENEWETYGKSAEFDFFNQFKDLPEYAKIQMIKALPQGLDMLGGALLEGIFLGRNQNNKNQNNGGRRNNGSQNNNQN